MGRDRKTLVVDAVLKLYDAMRYAGGGNKQEACERIAAAVHDVVELAQCDCDCIDCKE